MSRKTIYQFTVKKEEEVEQESTVNKKNKETGETEKVTTTKMVKKEVPYEILIFNPSRRQIEDADMEFSVEMSKCIKKGILTKAMLAKKYSDSGGLLSEDDSQNLMRLYRELTEVQQSLAKIVGKKNKSKEEKVKKKSLQKNLQILEKKSLI